MPFYQEEKETDKHQKTWTDNLSTFLGTCRKPTHTDKSCPRIHAGIHLFIPYMYVLSTGKFQERLLNK